MDVPAKVRVTSREVYGGLIPWLAFHESGFCWLEVEGPGTDASPVPHLFALAGKFCSTAGVLEGIAGCFLMRPPGEPLPAERVVDPPPFALFVCGFGDGAPIRRALDCVAAWDAGGRPGTEGPADQGVPDRCRAPPVTERDRRGEALEPARAGLA